MSYKIVRQLLEQRLASMAGVLATAWENVSYKPQVGVAYQRAFLLPGQTEQPTFGDSFRREVGLLQVTLFYPENDGSGAAMAYAEQLRSHFARGTVLASGSVRVVVEATPSIGAANNDGGFYVLPVSVNYRADVSA